MPEEAKVKAPEAPAKLLGLHRASGGELEHGVRDIKLLRPICHICAPEVEKAGWGWWDRCEHDPYVGEKGEFISVPVYEDDPEIPGARILVKRNERTVLRPFPNFVGVAKGRRYNNGRGPEDKSLWYGYIDPKDLRSPAYPNGIAPLCEYLNCFWQEGLKTYESGTFCQEREAILVYENERGTIPEVNNQDIRADQYAVSKMKLMGSQNA